MDPAWTPEERAHFEKLFERSDELDAACFAILELGGYSLGEDSDRTEAALAACELSIEHGRALRSLIAAGFATTAAGVMRMQFEAFARSLWTFYAATDAEVAACLAELDDAGEKAAKKLPMVTDMVRALEAKAPGGVHAMLEGFRSVHLPALNSFVHAGLHPLRRSSEGFPPELVDRLAKASNALLTMAAMTLANYSGDAAKCAAMRGIQRPFADCLPPLNP